MDLFIQPQIRHPRCHLTFHLKFLGPHPQALHNPNVILKIANSVVQYFYLILMMISVNCNQHPNIICNFLIADFPSSSLRHEDRPYNDNTESDENSVTEVDHVHRVNINTHGQKFSLELSPIQHLLSKRSALESTWFADGYPNNVSYTLSPKVSKHTLFLLWKLLRISR